MKLVMFSAKDLRLGEALPFGVRDAAGRLAEIDAHASRGAALLRADGRADTLWCDIVRHHHDPDIGATPDTPAQWGAALLKALGLYPPGSYVQLASGEIGIVVARGCSPNLPLVAGLVTPGGMPYCEMPLRATAQDRYKVRTAVATNSVRVRPVHTRVLALR